MPTFEHDGERLHYTIEGSGPAVLLLHSLGGSSEMWRTTRSTLARNCTVLALDGRGHGASTARQPFTIERFAEDAEALLDELAVGRAALVGLSMGGPAAMRVALRRPERVAALVLADTFAGGRPGGAERLAATRRRIEEIGAEDFAREYTASRLRPGTAPEVVAGFARLVVRTLPDTYLDTLASITAQDLRPRLAEIGAPTLVIVGREDVSTPPALARELSDSIPGARLEIIPDANHLANLDQPERFNAILSRFLEEIVPSARLGRL